jgi:hypothetical protein
MINNNNPYPFYIWSSFSELVLLSLLKYEKGEYAFISTTSLLIIESILIIILLENYKINKCEKQRGMQTSFISNFNVHQLNDEKHGSFFALFVYLFTAIK